MKTFIRAALGVLLTLSLMVAPGLTWTATAAPRPVVTMVGPGSGPLKQTVISIRGKHLKGATAVRFGKRLGTVVKRRGATEVRVRTPKGMRAGTVLVQVKTRKGWSKRTQRARYTFVAAPRVTRLSRYSGRFSGGQKVTIRGNFLKSTRRVTFGGRAARINKRTPRFVVVTTPLGVLGKAPVRVFSRGGQSRKVLKFTYVTPQRRPAARLAPRTGAFGTHIQWVSGGPEATAGLMEPWTVSLAPGAEIPEVGKGFIVRPGTPVFPSGLVGTVTDIAVQVDDSIRVTVKPTDITKTVKEGHLAYAGPVQAASTRARHLRTEVESGSSYALNGPTSLFCRDEQGQSVAFSSSISLAVDDQSVDTSLDWGGLFRKPRLKAAYSNELTLSGKMSVDASATCKIKPAWANAQRKIIPLGTSGATLSFGPTFEVKFSGKGTYSLDEVTRNTMTVDAELGSTPTVQRVSRTVKSVHTGALTFEAELTGGLSAQIGFLDRAGVEAKAQIGAKVGLTARSTQVCVDGEIFLRFGVGLFLDAIVARWDANIATLTISLAEIDKCSTAAGPATGTEPEILSSSLPDAREGTPYGVTLATAGNRQGTWTVTGGQLPPGTSLATTGVVSGTPTRVGTYSADVRFVDSDGSSAEAPIRIRVVPSVGIGGGDIQVQLRWTGAADLDLHVIDPADEEIYYSHPESESGGVLDHDANAGCNGEEDDDNAVENITWPTGQSPRGSYYAWVHVFAECDAPLDWRLIIRSQGRVILDRSGNGNSDTFIVEGGSITTTARKVMRPRTATPTTALPPKR